MNEWTSFLEKLDRARSDLRCDDGGVWYRGVTKRSYRLYPKLLRPNTNCSTHIEKDIYHGYQDLLGRDVAGKSSWDILTELQHHGSPTRLLDWTEVFGVALYFALAHNDESTISPAIWMINPFTIAGRARRLAYPDCDYNKEIAVFHNDNEFDYYQRFITKMNWPYDHPMPYRPPKLIPRIRAQRGFFTVHGNDPRPIDGIFRKRAIQVPIPRGAFKDARKFLDLAGINTLSLFPDAEGYAKSIEQRYRYIGKDGVRGRFNSCDNTAERHDGV